MGAKLITVFPGNHAAGRDSHQGIVVLFDGASGEPVALMDAASITAIRTAAASALATGVLANADVKTLAVLGSGVQARTHVEGMLAVRPFERVLVWSRSKEHAASLAIRVQSFLEARVDIVVVESAEDAVRAADVVCTVTASREPVLRGEWLRAGTHVNAVGASIPTARELDSRAVGMGRVFVDRRESALNEAGDLLIPMNEGAFGADHIRAELGEVLVGRAGGRGSREEITIFKSLGIAVEDLACARFLHDEARAAGAGTWVEL
jgi:ornithine cyclodeaminase